MTLAFEVLCLLSLSVGVYCTVEINMKSGGAIKIPPASDAACMARFIVHNSNWCSLAYTSENDDSTYGLPLSRIYSVSDGLPSNSTGIIYFMVSPLDLTAQDLTKNNNCSVIMSLAQSNYCYEKKYDAQDPRCAQAILSGKFITIQAKTEEFNLAKDVLWNRHPIMKFWYYAVPGHKWYFAKLEIHKIAVVDMFGGRKFPAVSDYFNKTCNPYLDNYDTDFHVISITNNTS